jgi:hypothetical protein
METRTKPAIVVRSLLMACEQRHIGLCTENFLLTSFIQGHIVLFMLEGIIQTVVVEPFNCSILECLYCGLLHLELYNCSNEKKMQQ